MAKVNPAEALEIASGKVGTINAPNSSNTPEALAPGEIYPTYGKVVATADAPYHAEGEVIKASVPVIHKMVKRGWAKETK